MINELAAFLLGVIIGVIAAAITLSEDEDLLYFKRNALLEECQAELPRNQYCEIEMIAKPKSKGASE